MNEKYLVGIDSGTQSTRVIIFNTRGEQICSGIGKHPPLIAEKQGWAEHGEMDVWIGLCEAARSAFSKFRGKLTDVVGIGLASQRGTIMAVDEKNRLIQRPISWMDSRMAYGIEPMPDDTDPRYKFLRFYSKANWLRINKPGVFEKTYKYLTVGGFLGHKLTAGYVDTVCNQYGGWPVDSKEWCVTDEPWICECVGIRLDQMSKLVMPGSIIGHITEEGAEETGFPAGCPVMASAGDKQCEVLGAGAIKEGQTYITLGTSTTLAFVSNEWKTAPDLSFLTYMSCIPKTYNYEAPLARGFWLVSWFRDNLGMDLDAEAKKQGVSIETLLNREARNIPPGSEGLVVIPDWQAPRSRPYGKGMIIGFDDRHTRAHMFRALIEGILLQLKFNTDVMCKQIGREVTELRVGGGGSRSKMVLQAVADIFDVPAIGASVVETCSLGAAICAAVGAGVYPSFEAAVDAMTAKKDCFYPVPENRELYRGIREKVIAKAYSTFEPILKELSEMTGQKS